MTKEEYLKELNKAFGDFKFFSEDHHYEYKGERVGMSVTRLIEEYTNDFDAESVAYKVAMKSDKSVQEVLDEWKQKNEWACRKGSIIHETVQHRWIKSYDTPIFPIPTYTEEQAKTLEKLSSQTSHFYYDYKDGLELIYNEYVIGSFEYDLASAIDALFINKLTGGLVLVDYKTNSDIHKNEKYAKNMKAPLDNLKDDSIHHYYIQLSIYKYIVEKYTGLQIEEMFIVWFSELNENYEIIEVQYLKEEVEKILEWRRYEWKKKKKIKKAKIFILKFKM